MAKIVAIAFLAFFGLSSGLELKFGAYEDFVISIAESVPQEHCRTILQNLEETLTSASQYLFSALDGRVFLRTATVVLPSSWPNSCAPKSIVSTSGDISDVTVSPQGPIRGRIWTQQSAGCGQNGDQIYLSYETLQKRDDTLGRSLIKEFAMYRYGVFEEQGYYNDPIYPNCYYDDVRKDNKVTGCSDLPIRDDGICENSAAFYNATKLVDDNARSSIMFAAEAPSVLMFCDEGTHDKYTPTKHNLICNRRSTFDVIINHSDFTPNTVVQNQNTNEITDTVPKITYKKHNITRYILIVENTQDMIQRESWTHLKVAIRKWAMLDLPKNSEVGVLLANETGSTKSSNILALKNSASRDTIVANIPFTPGDSSQPACIHCALKDAIEMLNERTKLTTPNNNVIILIAPGMNHNAQLENLIEEANKSKIRLATINYPELIRSQPLDMLALRTNGRAYTVNEERNNIDTSKLSTYFDLTNVLYNIVEEFHFGNSADLPLEIHRRKLTDDGRLSITGSFMLDNNMGEPARFMLYCHNIDLPLIRGLSLISPSQQIYTSITESLFNLKIITLNSNISEPGTWTYKIERYTGNPQPHYIQVMATPLSRIVPIVRAKFWTHRNYPDGPLILLTQVKYGELPVLGAKVEVLVTKPETNGSVVFRERFELLDTGNGDPDITKGDGVYTRYFSAARGGPGIYTFEVTATDNGNTAYTWQETQDFEDKPCCGSVIPTKSNHPLSPFQRVLPAKTIPFSSEDIVRSSQLSAGRIGDLKVRVKPDDMKAVLTWTSPDMGGHKVARYEIKYTTSLNDIVDNYETAANVWDYSLPPHPLEPGSETPFSLDMTKAKELLDKPLYFAIKAFPQLHSDSQASPVSNWVRVLVPSPPPPPTVPPTYSSVDHSSWPHQANSVGVDAVVPSMPNSGGFGLQVILPVVIGLIILVLILSLYCYFCVIKRRSRGGNKSCKNGNSLTGDKLSSTVTVLPSTPTTPQNNMMQGYTNHTDMPDHHTVGVPINSYSYDDEPKKRYSLVHQQEQQLIEELKQQQYQHQQREQTNTPNNNYGGLCIISSNSLQRNGGHALSPYNSWSASQLLHEHERRHSPLDNMIPEEQLLSQHQEMLMNGSQVDHMSLNGQNMDHISLNGQLVNHPDHYQGHMPPPVPPLPAYSSNGYPLNYNIYRMHPGQAPLTPNQQNHPIYQSMQRNDAYNPSLQGSLSSVNSGEKKKRNVTMV